MRTVSAVGARCYARRGRTGSRFCLRNLFALCVDVAMVVRCRRVRVGWALASNFDLRGALGATLKLVLRVLSTDQRHGQSEFARGTREVWAKLLSFARPQRGLLQVQSPTPNGIRVALWRGRPTTKLNGCVKFWPPRIRSDHEWKTQVQSSYSWSFLIRGGYPFSRRFEAELRWHVQTRNGTMQESPKPQDSEPDGQGMQAQGGHRTSSRQRIIKGSQKLCAALRERLPRPV